jgi:serine/threonine-protein kinase
MNNPSPQHQDPASQPASTPEFDQELWQLWQQGQRPDVQQFLAAAGPLSLEQVAAVLAVDQRERWQSGERVQAEVYLQAHSPLQADIEKALELVYGEFLLREELGEAPSHEEYLERFPQYADRLRQQFDLHRALMSRSGAAVPRGAQSGDLETVLSPTAHRGVPGRVRRGQSEPASEAGQDTPEGEPSGTPVSVSHPHATAETTRDERTTTAEPSPLSAPGERYTLSRLHAQGGLGQVWLARDSTLGREIALKELRPERAGYSSLLSRFVEEAKITGQLEHPGIVPVYELAHHPGNKQPFYTMRFIKGRTLSKACRAYHQKRPIGQAGTLDLMALLNAFVAVCNAVAYAHARGVIHRDLKGQNVVLGDFGEVVVLDWGLAKVTGARKDGAREDKDLPDPLLPVHLDDLGSREETAPGQVLGTPGYMAPEQAEGRQAEVDARTDVYGLGAILYEILTGRPPFAGDRWERVQRQIIESPPVPPHAIVTGTARALEAVCLKALAKKPENRYPSAGELAKEVQRYLADEPVQAYREPLPARLWRWTRRHRTLVTGLGALLLTAVAALGIGIVLIGRKEQEAVAARGRAEANYQLAREAVEQYFLKITQDPRLKEAGLRSLRQDLLEEAGRFYTRFIEERGQEPGLEYELSSAHVYLAMVREEMGAVAEAIDQALKGRDVLQKLADSHPEQPQYRERLAFAHNRLGLLLQQKGQLTEAHDAYLRAVALHQQLAEEFPQQRVYQFGEATVLHNLGWLAQSEGQRDEAEKKYRQAIGLLSPLLDTSPERAKVLQGMARSESNLGTLYHEHFAGRQAEAEQPLQKAVQLRRELVDLEPQNPDFQADLAQSYNNLAYLYTALKRMSEAERAYQEGLKVMEYLANRHRDSARYQASLALVLVNLGALYGNMNQWARGEMYNQRALTLLKDVAKSWPEFPEYRYRLALLHSNLGFSYESRGLWDKAEHEFLDAIQIAEQLVEAHSASADFTIDLAGFCSALGELLVLTCKPQAAFQWYTRAADRIEPIRKQTPKDIRANFQYVRAQEGIARSLSRLGKHGEALRAWDRAIQLAGGPLKDALRVGRAVTLARMHKPAEATAEMEPLLEKGASAETFYNAACVFALCAATPGLDTGRADRYGARAVELLQRAVEKGFHDVDGMRTDNDFVILRKRSDFQQLLSDLQKKALGSTKEH